MDNIEALKNYYNNSFKVAGMPEFEAIEFKLAKQIHESFGFKAYLLGIAVENLKSAINKQFNDWLCPN